MGVDIFEFGQEGGKGRSESTTVDASVVASLRTLKLHGAREAEKERQKVKQADEADEKRLVDPTPDPFWPEGAIPTHLTPAQRQDPVVQQAWEIVGGIDGHWRCIECGATTGRSIKNPQLCGTCWQKAQERTALMQKTNDGWIEQAQQLGLALYERQPEETDNEWMVWERYRSYYPLAMPRWSVLAKELGVSVGFVVKTSQRWSFKARMIQWAKAVDSEGQEKRIRAIREMNDRQLSMAQALQEKLCEAITYIEPALLKPGELVQMLKFSTALEQSIRAYREDKVDTTVVETQGQIKQRTKAEDLNEVLGILQSTGVMPGSVDAATAMMPPPQAIGVEHKTTTTILIKNGE